MLGDSVCERYRTAYVFVDGRFVLDDLISCELVSYDKFNLCVMTNATHFSILKRGYAILDETGAPFNNFLFYRPVIWGNL